MQPSTSNLLEVRIYGLNISITTDSLSEFLSKSVRLRGVLLHPPVNGPFQWAQIWVDSEAEVQNLLGLRGALLVNGISITRVGLPILESPPPTSSSFAPHFNPISHPASSIGTPTPQSLLSQSFQGNEATAPWLPRNLYVLNLPLDLTQWVHAPGTVLIVRLEFKDLFTSYGRIEHAILLSQLDGIGRRRGFVLMSAHHEASTVMNQMHGKWIDGFKLNLSWALVQREAKNTPNATMPNRVVHPPAVPVCREPSAECTVIVDNLDVNVFPDIETICSVFRSFGPIYRVVKRTEAPLSVSIQFENIASASALINANSLFFGDRLVYTSGLGGSAGGGAAPCSGSGPAGIASTIRKFDPFAGERAVPTAPPFVVPPAAPYSHHHAQPHPYAPQTPQSLSLRSYLNVESKPFVPTLNPVLRASRVVSPMGRDSFVNQGDLLVFTDTSPAGRSASSYQGASFGLDSKSSNSDTDE